MACLEGHVERCRVYRYSGSPEDKDDEVKEEKEQTVKVSKRTTLPFTDVAGLLRKSPAHKLPSKKEKRNSQETKAEEEEEEEKGEG